MGDPGKSVVVEGGKRGVLLGGKSAVYNAEETCPACCDTVYALTPCTASDDPCINCNGTQPDATVAIIPGGSCNATCQGAGGTYTFDSWQDLGDGDCQWKWTKDNWELLAFFSASGSPYQQLVTLVNPGTAAFTAISMDWGCDCATGELVGDAALGGLNYYSDCRGCTVDVTLGGVAQGDCDDRCPGGALIFSRDDLSAYVGKVIEIAEDLDICYTVSVYGGTPDTVIDVTPTVVYDNCTDCCQDTGGSPA
jgi:hypothetical protein